MESLENNSFVENLSWNTSNTDPELDNTILILPSIFSNVSTTATGNLTDEGPALYQVPTVVVVVLTIFYGAICAAAILGNLLVLGLVMVSKNLVSALAHFVNKQ